MQFLPQAIFSKCKSISSRLHLRSRLSDFASIFRNRRGYMVLTADWKHSLNEEEVFYIGHVYDYEYCPIIGKQGFQFFKTPQQAFAQRLKWLDHEELFRIVEIEALGDVENYLYRAVKSYLTGEMTHFVNLIGGERTKNPDGQAATNRVRVIRELGLYEVQDLLVPEQMTQEEWKKWSDELYEYDLNNLR